MVTHRAMLHNCPLKTAKQSPNLPPRDYPTSSDTKSATQHLRLPPRDYPAAQSPNLPPRDYPTSLDTKSATRHPRLPPRDYPASRSTASSHHASASKTKPKGVQLDDDYYTQMMMAVDNTGTADY